MDLSKRCHCRPLANSRVKTLTQRFVYRQLHIPARSLSRADGQSHLKINPRSMQTLTISLQRSNSPHDDLQASQDREPHDTEDRLTPLPAELLTRIAFFLLAPGEERWTNKADLKAFNLVNKTLSGAVQEHLFKYITLTYFYDSDRQTRQWKAPKLIQSMLTQSGVSPMVKNYAKAVRLVIVPMPEPTDTDLDVIHERYHFEAWTNHVIYRLQRQYDVSPCVYVPNATWTYAQVQPTFSRFFGDATDNNGNPVSEVISSRRTGVTFTREMFASYVFRTMHTLFSHLPNAKHIEAGLMPMDRGWIDDEYGTGSGSTSGYDLMANYGLAFANAIILKRVPQKVSSFRVHGIARSKEYSHVPDLTSFSVNDITTQLGQHSSQIKSLDIDICCFETKHLPMFSSWSSTATCYVNMLHNLPNLTTLRLTNTSDSGAKDYIPRSETVFINSILANLRLPTLQTLALKKWTVSPSTLPTISRSFKALEKLRLESLTIMSNEKSAWPEGLNQLTVSYDGKISLSIDDLKNRDARSRLVKSINEALMDKVRKKLRKGPLE